MKNKKVVVGAVVLGIGYLVKEMKTRKKLKELEKDVATIEQSMEVFADTHNDLANLTVKEFEHIEQSLGGVMDDVDMMDTHMYEIDAMCADFTDEFASVYDHISDLAHNQE